MPVEEGGLLRAVVVRLPARPRADDPLNEVAHGEEQQQDQDARQLPRYPAHVVEEDVDGELATAHCGAGVTVNDGRTALLALTALDLSAAPDGLASGDETCRQKGTGGGNDAVAPETGHHFYLILDRPVDGWHRARACACVLCACNPTVLVKKSFQVLQVCLSSCELIHPPSHCRTERDSRCPPSSRRASLRRTCMWGEPPSHCPVGT